MREWTLAELAARIGAELRGDSAYRVSSVQSLTAAGPAQISFLANAQYKAGLAATQAGAVVLRPEDAEGFAGQALLHPNPYLAYARLSQLFDRTPVPAPGLHPRAVVAATAEVSPEASIGPNAVIGEGVRIGAGTIVEAGVVIGDRTVIGNQCRLRANVAVYHDCVLGDRVQVHAGTVIGSDGFGNANDAGRWVHIAQLGRVVIHDDVDIGANTCIDRGALDDTVIHEGVIIDNQVHIAHNVVIGKHTAIAGQVGIAGSTTIGAYCVMAGQVGIAGHLEICDKVFLQGQAMITKSITEPGAYASGTGFEPADKWRKTAVRLRQLDDMAKKLKHLELELRALTTGKND